MRHHQVDGSLRSCDPPDRQQRLPAGRADRDGTALRRRPGPERRISLQHLPERGVRRGRADAAERGHGLDRARILLAPGHAHPADERVHHRRSGVAQQAQRERGARPHGGRAVIQRAHQQRARAQVADPARGQRRALAHFRHRMLEQLVEANRIERSAVLGPEQLRERRHDPFVDREAAHRRRGRRGPLPGRRCRAGHRQDECQGRGSTHRPLHGRH